MGLAEAEFTPEGREMTLFDVGRIGVAVFGALLMVFVARGLGGEIYQAEHLTQPAYRILDRPEPYVDLATLHRRWPEALDERQDRLRLMAYMRDIPEDVGPTGIEPASLTVGKAEPQPDLPLPQLLAQADAAKGERVATKCRSCHTFEQGERNNLGPNLWNIVGSPRARLPDFNYSSAMRGYGGEWTFDSLFEYLENPKAYVKGTSMSFAGIRRAADRANLLAYLRTKSDKPIDFPVADAPTPTNDAGPPS